MMRNRLRFLAAIVVVTALGLVWGQRSGDAALIPGEAAGEAIPVILVDHGYHAGLVFQRSDLVRIAESEDLRRLQDAIRDFIWADYVEIGWGDEDFYRHVPRLSLATAKFAVRALLGLNERSVLRVVGYSAGLPQRVPPGIAKEVRLSPAGLVKLLQGLDASFRAGEGGWAIPLPASDPYGQYFEAIGRYGLFNVCNHWAARLLNAAGLPVNLVLATHSNGLFRQVPGRPLP